jgi:hypothetical protein
MRVKRLSAHTGSLPGLVSITATAIEPPPAWALMERRLMSLMEQGAGMMVEKYTERGGAVYYADAVDDLYEMFYNWGLFYAMGAGERLLDWALQEWNATTRISDDSIQHRLRYNDFRKRFVPQIYNEYYNYAVPGGAEWHHKGEGNMAFYDFGVADPTVSENVRRTRRFAAMYIGEDPEAPNYDPRYRVFRSPMQTSRGPWLQASVDDVKMWLQGGHPGINKEWVPKPMGVRASLYPVVKDLEPNWYENPERREEIVKLFNKVVLNSDSPNNLDATALVTNAYLYTGEEKYKRWVVDYVEAWMERMRRNNGIMPDNVGPTGKIGEHREGQWWGGLYGWNHYQGLNIMFHGIVTAAECALLLTGDFGYLELLRSQVTMLLDNSITREDGQLMVPVRYGPNGWENFQPMRILEVAHLYHASMAQEDYELFVRVRAGDRERDWNQVEPEHEKNRQLADGHQNMARFQYYDGKNPDWPEKILQAESLMALTAFEAIRRDDRDVETIIAENYCPPNPVFTKGLTQVMLGAPQSVYNGGLLRAQVRYFDQDHLRPGLPEDVAVLVEKLEAGLTGIHLVNLSPTETRNVIVQAGAFGEHRVTDVRFEEESQEGLENNPFRWVREGRVRTERVVPVNARHFALRLPPSTSIRVDIGMRRFVNRPSYAFPWHGERVPMPFQ